MNELSLRVYPDPILSEKMPEIKKFDDSLREKIKRMFEIMYESRGIGLAANQAGWRARVLVMNLSGDANNKSEELVLINPEIVSFSKETFIDEEGCLSFPQIRAEVERRESLTLKAFDLEGREMAYPAEGLFSRCIQHEMDHLNGITFVDRMTPSQRAELKTQIEALRQAYALKIS